MKTRILKFFIVENLCNIEEVIKANNLNIKYSNLGLTTSKIQIQVSDYKTSSHVIISKQTFPNILIKFKVSQHINHD